MLGSSQLCVYCRACRSCRLHRSRMRPAGVKLTLRGSFTRWAKAGWVGTLIRYTSSAFPFIPASGRMMLWRLAIIRETEDQKRFSQGCSLEYAEKKLLGRSPAAAVVTTASTRSQHIRNQSMLDGTMARCALCLATGRAAMCLQIHHSTTDTWG